MRRVVIPGGGSAGWVVAATLGRVFGPLLDISLVASDDIPTVGVGESTIPTARTFHHLLAIDERKFLRDTQSTFKLGILFENWGAIGDRYIHSFGTLGRSTWMADFHHIWMKARELGIGGDLGNYCYELKAAEAGKFATSETVALNYAYHLDAGLYARSLRGFAEEFGVKRVEGKISRVEQDGESGFITALALESDLRIEGDLFIDCTGFRGLLIEQTLQTGYEDWSQWLPNNSAMPIQARSVEPPMPLTRATAHEAGWLWGIPLQHRVGHGLVYCSDFMSDDRAHELLHSMVKGEILLELRTLRFRAGRRRKFWNKNCIAFGLSSGFVEPLESTSIHLFMNGVTRLVQLFPFGGVSEAVADRFNDVTGRELEAIRDFVVLHYKMTRRNDTGFWNYCREMAIPDTLHQRIELFREHAIAFQAADELFRVDSWMQVMLGQGLQPLSHHGLGDLMSDDQLRKSLDGLSTNIARAVEKLPTHQDFIQGYAAAPFR